VKSKDGTTSRDFTVTVYQSLLHNFNTATLQGWHNRVWDLSANGGSGGWIELAPDATTMPTTVNGGAIQPPSANNGLFVPLNGAVWVSGDADNHLNTLWLRSPAFYLDAVADLTVDLSRGIANTADPANEAAVPYAAADGAGWKGVVLRRVGDGAFLLTKPRTGTSGDEWRTVTFTAAELAPYDGVACTLELINSDRGGWGWLVMDNVSIPTTGLVPVPPFASWINSYPSLVGQLALPGADPELDRGTNLEEFAFATDPTSGALNPITYDAGSVTAHGQPKLDTAGGYFAVFGRRVDYVAARLIYKVQFSADLDLWVDDNAVPTVVAADSEIEAVRVPFPATILTPGGAAVVPKFFRIKITGN
jgi:hypothetical protein